MVSDRGSEVIIISNQQQIIIRRARIAQRYDAEGLPLFAQRVSVLRHLDIQVKPG